jgi:hypothetical protein
VLLSVPVAGGSVLLPSAMNLLGERNRYLPRWLEWMPRLEVEARRPVAGEAQLE